MAGAAFALIYAHRQKDLIPDFVPEFGHADESAVVRAVLIEHEKILAGYAGRHQLNWPKLTDGDSSFHLSDHCAVLHHYSLKNAGPTAVSQAPSVEPKPLLRR